MYVDDFIELVQQMRHLQATYAVYPTSSVKVRVRKLECEVDAEIGRLIRAMNDGETTHV